MAPSLGLDAATLRRLNIGVVGIGRMGQRHAMNILHHTLRANLICVCSPAKSDLDWADQNLKHHGVKVYATFEEMIMEPGLEAVVIASATSFHVSHSLESLRRGIHVLCEKPVTLKLDELQSLVHQCEAHPETKMMVGFTRRFDADYKYAREKVVAGRIGRPLILRSHGCEPFDTSDFFVPYAKASGGIFVDSTIHDIDLTLSFFGENIQPKALWATGVVAKHLELGRFDDVDNAVGVVEFWGGMVAHYYHSRTAVNGYDNTTEIFGMDGKLTINSVPRLNRVDILNTSGVVNEVIPGWIDRYKEAFVTEINDFTSAILDQTDLPMKLTSAITSLKIGLALQESLVTGERIQFDQQGNRLSSNSCISGVCV
ncbi:hypothetical protein BDV36DRAFT_306078 [Aspergillus pseudocaelatus]|uniref:NAD-binding Rossmann fold oxidoreductase family protein n=1 Tax=Aspergillus pseudocaelatus TaxID=1825620 RepID=A0ABQ6X4H9_9EURO|nr:hypothetical protein BDV36DRAFT_306078 [Aspergillus pseudocaelatus]